MKRSGMLTIAGIVLGLALSLMPMRATYGSKTVRCGPVGMHYGGPMSRSAPNDLIAAHHKCLRIAQPIALAGLGAFLAGVASGAYVRAGDRKRGQNTTNSLTAAVG